MTQQSFTAMSDEGLNALKSAVQDIAPEGYAMSLNPTDMRYLIDALSAAYVHGADGGCNDRADDAEAEAAEWAGEFLSSMAETLGIEFI